MSITGLHQLSHVLGLSVRTLKSLRDNIPQECVGNVCSSICNLPEKALLFTYARRSSPYGYTVLILRFIPKPPGDQSSKLKQNTTRNSRMFQDRNRAGESRDSRRRFFACGFCTSFCRPFP